MGAAPDTTLEFRPEIQGVRAIAVTLVFAFHLWPSGVSGGYVGVDVFFVISGYLITLGLLREISRSGQVSLLAFYVRRARRILPAATLVLLVVTLMLPFLPETRLRTTTAGIVASALYVENWQNVRWTLDYFHAAAPTAVQHFWSLSIEEQFYLFWPLLIIVALVAGRKIDRRIALAVIIAAVMAASFAASVFMTASNPAPAYFVTQTRVWELALGGAIAMLGQVRLSALAAGVAGTAGLAAILLAGFAFSESTPFPGYLALLPTLGAALIVVAGPQPSWSPGRILRLAPLLYLGDRSYSLYLWHWPLIVFYGIFWGAMTGWAGLAIIVAVIALAHVTYRYVEQPFRARPRATGQLRPLAYAFGAIAGCVLAVATTYFLLADRRPVVPIAIGDTDYPGPTVLLGGAVAPTGVPLRPSLQQVAATREGITSGCLQGNFEAEVLSCVFGEPDSDVRVVLVGDSLAHHWLPALIPIAGKRGWALDTYLKGSCPFFAPTSNLDVGSMGCREWRAEVLADILRNPPAIMITALAPYVASGDPALRTLADGMAEVWRSLQASGVRVVAIAGTPAFKESQVECLALGLQPCGLSRQEALPAEDPIRIAADRTGATLVDMTDGLCGPQRCEAVVGNILVYRDNGHLTADYARLLSPYFAARAGF